MLRRFPLLFIFLFICSCSGRLYVQREAATFIRVDSTAGKDTALAAMLMAYKTGVDNQMKTIVGFADTALTKGLPECTLGNFIADAQLMAAQNVDNNVIASISNQGGIRINFIAAGAIEKGKIYELMPFDNLVTIVEMPGTVLRQLCNTIAANGGWPVSGVNFIIKRRIAVDILINNRPLTDTALYKVAVSDYIANGGDDCSFLKPLKKNITTILVRDALVSYLSETAKLGKPLHAEIEKRIVNAE